MDQFQRERAFRPWYKDRDFNEVKSGNDDIVASLTNDRFLNRIIDSHNLILEDRYKYMNDDETKRMQLAACSVISKANTRPSLAKALDMDESYMCSAVIDVSQAVLREIELREDAERLARIIRHGIATIGWEEVSKLVNKYLGEEDGKSPRTTEA